MIILPKVKNNKLLQDLKELFKSKSSQDQVRFSLNVIKDVWHLSEYNEYEYVNYLEEWLECYTINYDQVEELTYYQHKIEHNLIKLMQYVSNEQSRELSYSRSSYPAQVIFDCCHMTNDFRSNMKFYFQEVIGLELKPHSDKIAPLFDIECDYLAGLDWLIEYRHDDLIIQEDGYCFKFFPHIQEKSVSELIQTVFSNKLSKKQVIRVLSRLLENT